MTPRLAIMVDSREIEQAEAPDREVGARWRKAVATYQDAGKDLGSDSRLTLYYQAGLQAATALVRAAGYRVMGADHHRHTFEAVRALDVGELSRVARELSAFRRSRHQAVYDWAETPLDESDEAAALDLLARNVGRMLELGRAWLLQTRPSLSGEIGPVP